ncbi:MAG: hypothetical protein WC284_15535 [Candidimonas sp.]
MKYWSYETASLDEIANFTKWLYAKDDSASFKCRSVPNGFHVSFLTKLAPSVMNGFLRSNIIPSITATLTCGLAIETVKIGQMVPYSGTTVEVVDIHIDPDGTKMLTVEMNDDLFCFPYRDTTDKSSTVQPKRHQPGWYYEVSGRWPFPSAVLDTDSAIVLLEDREIINQLNKDDDKVVTVRLRSVRFPSIDLWHAMQWSVSEPQYEKPNADFYDGLLKRRLTDDDFADLDVSADEVAEFAFRHYINFFALGSVDGKKCRNTIRFGTNDYPARGIDVLVSTIRAEMDREPPPR